METYENEVRAWAYCDDGTTEITRDMKMAALFLRWKHELGLANNRYDIYRKLFIGISLKSSKRN
jgi:hypothetical protein